MLKFKNKMVIYFDSKQSGQIFSRLQMMDAIVSLDQFMTHI